MSSSRSFTVFVDQPARAASKSSEPPATLSTTTTTADALKENLHPVTGENPSAPTETAVKKRKSNVLATKLYIPPTTVSAAKKGKALAADDPAEENKAAEPRKRAATSGQDGKLLVKKPRRLVSAGRVRTLKELPKVEEEPEPASSVLKATLIIEASPSNATAAEGTAAASNDGTLTLDDLARALDQMSLETGASPAVVAEPRTSDLTIVRTLPTIPYTVSDSKGIDACYIHCGPLQHSLIRCRASA